MEVKEFGLAIIEKLVSKDKFDRADMGAPMEIGDLRAFFETQGVKRGLIDDTVKALHRDCLVDVAKPDKYPATTVSVRTEGLNYFKAQTRVF